MQWRAWLRGLLARWNRRTPEAAVAGVSVPPPAEPSRQPTPTVQTVREPDVPPATAAVAAEERKPSLRGLRREIEDTANEVLDVFETSEREHPDQNWVVGTYVDAYDDLLGCDYHLVDELCERLEGGGRYYLLGDDANDAASCVWPLDIGILIVSDPGAPMKVSRLMSATPAEVRGKTRIVPSKIGILAHAEFSDGRWWAENTIVGLLGGKWKDIGNTVIKEGYDYSLHRSLAPAHEIESTTDVIVAAALTERYSWHVALGASAAGPRLVLPTNPGGCLSLFRDRGRGEGAGSRRAALRHWVRNHYRNSASSHADLSYVCDHLRGATRFTWRGLDCELMVSEFDLEKNVLFREQAAQWRSQRKHNRIRLRLKDRRDGHHAGRRAAPPVA